MGPGHSLKFSLAQLGPPVAGGEWNDLTFGTQFSVKETGKDSPAGEQESREPGVRHTCFPSACKWQFSHFCESHSRYLSNADAWAPFPA